MKEKNKKYKKTENKGITLVALVITIIVLIILAGISINLVLGENGLFARARKAAEDYQQAAINEQEGFNDLYDEIETYGEGNLPENQETLTKIPTTIEEALKQPKQIYDKNITVKDEYDNPVVIPAGFHIVPNEEDDVEYKYTGDGNNPSVQDGIVVEDNEGNQFVWIPVGDINNKKGEPKTTITLGRYTFGDNGTPSDPITNGTTIANNYTEETQEEHTKSDKKNAIAKDIEAFKSSATINHGYYLARYEASYKDGIKPLSQVSKQALGGSLEPSTRTQGDLWNWITQSNAAKAAQAMYAENDNFTSDLVNSYAWDTAIVFIQEYSGDADYSRQTAKNYVSKKLLPDNTGERDDGTTDKVCNIYDMASNCWEWTTETSTIIRNSNVSPCVNRGGGYDDNSYYTSSRYGDVVTINDSSVTFRSTLYLGDSKS